VSEKRPRSVVKSALNLFDFLYQEYFRARLAEMQKQLMLSAQIPEAKDISDPVGSADRDSGVGDDRTTAATQSERAV
jgi:hypothetical protein